MYINILKCQPTVKEIRFDQRPFMNNTVYNYFSEDKNV